MKRLMVLGLVGLVSVLGSACASGDDGNIGGDESNIAIDKTTENPAKVLGADFSVKIKELIGPQDEGKSFGLDDSRIPYPDTYWPFRVKDDNTGKITSKNGIDDRWQGENIESPLEKFMAVFDPAKSADARDWESKNHGEKVPNVANWFGHCPGWTASAMFTKPLPAGITVKNQGGQVVECASANEAGCVKFEIGDINALQAEVFEDARSRFLGARCDTLPQDIPRDEHGRVLKSGCRGLNPGSLLVVLANRMKNVKNAPNFVPQSIAIDAQNEFNTAEIWNQPAYRYEVNEARPISEKDAIKVTTKPGTPQANATKYPWNKDAKGFMQIDIGIHWVTELGPNRQMISGKDSTRIMRLVAVIELDGDPNDANTTVIGGEFLDDPSAGAQRLRVPPFVWTTDGLGPDGQAGRHNPFVKNSQVMRLVQLALQ